MTKIDDIVLGRQNKDTVGNHRASKIRNIILEHVAMRNDEIFSASELKKKLDKEGCTKSSIVYHTKILCDRGELGKIKIGGNVFFGVKDAICETEIKLKELEKKEAEEKTKDEKDWQNND